MGESGSIERAMSLTGGRLLTDASRPGTCTRIIEPGLKPSLRFHSVGSMWTPLVLAGIDARSSETRRPVALVGSGRVKRLLGNGSRQSPASKNSQRSGWSTVTSIVPAKGPPRSGHPGRHAVRPASIVMASTGTSSRPGARSRFFDRPMLTPRSMMAGA